MFPNIRTFAKDAWRVEKAKTIVQYFYIITAFWFISRLTSNNFLELQNKDFSPIWANSWIRSVTPEIAQAILIAIFVIGAICSIAFYHYRMGRIVVFVALLQLTSLQLSAIRYPVIEWYPWINTAFLLVFLPDFAKKSTFSRDKSSKFLIVFWGAQALFLVGYTLTGIHKVIFQFTGSEVSILDTRILSQILAYKLTKDLHTGFFGTFIANNTILSYPLYLGAIYLQFFSFWAAIRVSLQRLWAIALIFFHIGTAFMFDIVFLQMVMLLLILFLDSPFLEPNVSFLKTARGFPLFGPFIGYLFKITRRSL